MAGPNHLVVGDFDQDAVNTFRSSPDVEYVAQNGIMSAFDTQYVRPPLSALNPFSQTCLSGLLRLGTWLA